MDASTLARAMGNVSGVNYHALVGPFNDAMVQAGCTNLNRAAMWCAQLGHESVGLKYMREIASGSAYEGRRDLGNIYPGDGVRFAGRGPIQVTGRNNYANLSRWAHGKGYVPSPTYFVDNPVELETPRYGFLGAVWYWTVARPQLNTLADNGWIWDATRAINGGTNGINDRIARWNRCRGLGNAILPTRTEVKPAVEKVLNYSRTQVTQDTFYNCGPASTQTIINSRNGEMVSEATLGRELRTHTGGTDWIGQFPAVLNRRIGGNYKVVEMPNDPPNAAQRQRLWDDVVRSINAGYGVVANIVAPPSNYPRAVPPSTTSPAYGGGTVYHYFAIMGYSDGGGRRYWIADSGFSPYGYWISHDQLCTLIPPKGYAAATVAAPTPDLGGLFMSLSKERQEELAAKIDRIHHELTYEFQSLVEDDKGKQSTWRGTLVGYILQADRKLESINEVRLPGLQRAIDKVSGLFQKGN